MLPSVVRPVAPGVRSVSRGERTASSGRYLSKMQARCTRADTGSREPGSAKLPVEGRQLRGVGLESVRQPTAVDGSGIGRRNVNTQPRQAVRASGAICAIPRNWPRLLHRARETFQNISSLRAASATGFPAAQGWRGTQAPARSHVPSHQQDVTSRTWLTLRGGRLTLCTQPLTHGIQRCLIFSVDWCLPHAS